MVLLVAVYVVLPLVLPMQVAVTLVLLMLVLAGRRRLAAGCRMRATPSRRMHVSAAGGKVLCDIYPPNLIGGG